ncbi:hypothetical protein [Salinispora cortesiana]|uniref:hypothetical protein n=1 Tax=Salinispora cortesiana TaxID=1305843 RepID=UPI0003FA6686|nr:hypothetical protein [Salinispora cortesiana]
MSALVEYAVLACMAAGILSAAVVLLVSRNAVLALRVGLDLWLAASLLRIAEPPVGEHLLYVVAIMVIRQLIRVALVTSWSQRRPTDPGLSQRPSAR